MGANLTFDFLIFDIWTLLKKKTTPNTAKSKYIFHSNLRPGRALIFGYLDSLMDNFFAQNIYFPRFRPPSWDTLGPNLDQNCKF